jgi:hypothetical protein
LSDISGIEPRRASAGNDTNERLCDLLRREAHRAIAGLVWRRLWADAEVAADRQCTHNDPVVTVVMLLSSYSLGGDASVITAKPAHLDVSTSSAFLRCGKLEQLAIDNNTNTRNPHQ